MMIRRPWGFPQMHRELNHLCRTMDEQPEEQEVTWSPSVDIREEEDHFLLMADLPGVNKDEIEVKVEDNTLLLSGKRDSVSEPEASGYRYNERRFGSFSRRFRLGEGVNPTGIEAAYKDGVLTVTLPKKPEAQPRQIPVAVN
jgi:HSP20 family protein